MCASFMIEATRMWAFVECLGWCDDAPHTCRRVLCPSHTHTHTQKKKKKGCQSQTERGREGQLLGHPSGSVSHEPGADAYSRVDTYHDCTCYHCGMAILGLCCRCSRETKHTVRLWQQHNENVKHTLSTLSRNPLSSSGSTPASMAPGWW